MNHLGAAFKPGRKALIAYLTVGYPSLEVTYAAAEVLAESGWDIIELGIPFSDPLADGATIQKSSHQALINGVSVDVCLEAAAEIRRRVDTPLVFMTYYNPVLHFGLKGFCRAAADAGAAGIIVPDLPPEEGAELGEAAEAAGLDLVYLLSPTSNDERIGLVAEKAQGFIYLVSLTGVTGVRSELPPEMEGFVGRVRAKTDKPLCIGFGVSTPEQAVRAARAADGVIVGSRIIQLMEQDESLASLKDFALKTRNALNLL